MTATSFVSNVLPQALDTGCLIVGSSACPGSGRLVVSVQALCVQPTERLNLSPVFSPLLVPPARLTLRYSF